MKRIHHILYQQPTEEKKRSAITLFRMIGEDRVLVANSMFKRVLQRKLKQSTQLVDKALDGNMEKMHNELIDYSDPNSKNDYLDGTALTAAVKIRSI